MEFGEDSQATIQMSVTGRNKQFRHAGRTHGVQLSWLHDIFQPPPDLALKYLETAGQCADIFTKSEWTLNKANASKQHFPSFVFEFGGVCVEALKHVF